MTEQGPDWEAIVNETDKTATDFGHIAMLKDQGRLKRYLFIYEYEDDEGEQTYRTAWSQGEALWTLGAAVVHVRAAVEAGWVEAEGPEDD